jgi:hypothetical protein
VVAAIVLLVIGAILLLLPRLRLHGVTGRVDCLSGRPVTGVWVQDLDSTSDSKYAVKQIDPRTPSDIGYDADIRGDRYQLHVGCGGTLLTWAAKPWSVDVSGSTNDFVCYDVPGSAHFGSCLSVPS